MFGYDEVVAEVNKICDSNCFSTPKTDCPYYCVCQMCLPDGAEYEQERTEIFEAALMKRYYELHPRSVTKA